MSRKLQYVEYTCTRGVWCLVCTCVFHLWCSEVQFGAVQGPILPSGVDPRAAAHSPGWVLGWEVGGAD